MSIVKPGAINVTRNVQVVDKTTGLGKIALTNSDISSASYVRTRGAKTLISTSALGSATAGFSAGGFIKIDDTDLPGLYRFDIPDAAFAKGVDEVEILIVFTSNAVMEPLSIGIDTTPAAVWDSLRADHEVQSSFGEVHLPIASGAVLGTPTPTATVFKTDINVPFDCAFDGAVLVLVSGTGVRGSRRITFSDGDDTLTFDEDWVPVPSAGDKVLLIPQSYFDNVTGDVIGNIRVDLLGNVIGNVNGNVVGNVNGNVVGSIGSLGTTAKADVNAEVDSALNTAIPGSPTADSVNERIKTLDDNYTAARAALLDNLDAAVSSRSDFDETANPVELLDSGGAAGTSAAELVDDVWDELRSAHEVQGSFGEVFGGITSGAVPAGGGPPTSTTFETDLSFADNFFNGMWVYFITGNQKGIGRRIVDYDDDEITIEPPYTQLTPSVSDRFVIVPEEHNGFSQALAELTAVPGAGPTVEEAIMFLYMALRNSVVTDNTDTKVANDAGTPIGSATISDAASVFTRGKYT